MVKREGCAEMKIRRMEHRPRPVGRMTEIRKEKGRE